MGDVILLFFDGFMLPIRMNDCFDKIGDDHLMMLQIYGSISQVQSNTLSRNNVVLINFI